jgi:D-arabinose 1-dehydrogenase-like Zn-dependent alcohol dehydrogenase
VLGATGGVGGYAVQIARSRGAHVIATVRGDADEARRLGAEEVYDTNAVDVLSALRSSHPDGIDAILDLISGPDAIRRDADVLRPGGSIVSANHAADEAWFAERQITAHNISGPAGSWSTPQVLNEVARLLADGKITARIRATVELDGVGAVLSKLRDGGLRGKAVIRL